METYENLKLDNQLCFPLYACAKEVVRQYRKPLETLNLTYTQYIVMMVFWEFGGMTESELGRKIHLDSGTLAPLLKRLEKQGFVIRERPENRENMLFVNLTEKGEQLKHRAAVVPNVMKDYLGLTPAEGVSLRRLLDKAMANMNRRKELAND